jgi:hypothetical protein
VVRAVVVDVVYEDPSHGSRKEIREQERPAVDDVAPRLADAADHGQAPQRQGTQDAGEGIVRQRRHFRCHLVF